MISKVFCNLIEIETNYIVTKNFKIIENKTTKFSINKYLYLAHIPTTYYLRIAIL